MLFQSSDGLDPSLRKAVGFLKNIPKANAEIFFPNFFDIWGRKPQGVYLSIKKESFPLVNITREAKETK